jgi:DNA-binding CsgD family transcriptional regulator
LANGYPQQIKEGRIPSYEQLSPREREVIRLIARGRTNKEIAKRLSISVRTVERHRSSIMDKLGLQNRAELIAYAVQQGLLRDTVGKPGRRGKMRGGGWHVLKNTITVGDAGRNGTDREEAVARE